MALSYRIAQVKTHPHHGEAIVKYKLLGTPQTKMQRTENLRATIIKSNQSISTADQTQHLQT
jgi:hypothetical protein